MKLKKLLRTAALSLLASATMLSSGAFAGCAKSEDAAQTDSSEKGTGSGAKNDAGDKTDPTPTSSPNGGSDASDSESLSDTVRWFNASYAILTELNGWDYTIFAGLKPSLMVAGMAKGLLEDSWDVTDRASADETMDWLLGEGHRYDFADLMGYLEGYGLGEVTPDERAAFLLENFDIAQEDADFYVTTYAMYEQYGAEAIDAWDYCRGLNLMGFFYLAGYYSETEALDGSLEIAKTLQAKFSSWDTLVDSYLRGYEYWAEESSDARREVYEDLKKREDNPYSVDYNTELVKTW